MLERPALPYLARRASIQSIRRLVALEAYCDTRWDIFCGGWKLYEYCSREEGLEIVSLLAACRWSSVGRLNVTVAMVCVALMLQVSAFLPSIELFLTTKTIKHKSGSPTMRESQLDLISRARTGGTGWPGPLGEVWEAWAGLLLAGNTFLARFFSTCIKILSQIQQVTPNFH